MLSGTDCKMQELMPGIFSGSVCATAVEAREQKAGCPQSTMSTCTRKRGCQAGQGREPGARMGMQSSSFRLLWSCLAHQVALISLTVRLTPKKEHKPKYVSDFELQMWVLKSHEMRHLRCLLQHESTHVGHK